MAALTSPDGPVRAAGGVVWRPGRGGVEVCLIHRPRYDDWSLPKGKLHRHEHPLVGAVREVAEEIGVLAVPQVRLPTAGYLLAGGTPKSVDYWFMRAGGGAGFVPNHEVDEVVWVPVGEAAGRLSYDHDVTVVRRAAGLPPVTAVVVLLRHGYAGERDEWAGPDRVRPLDERGRRQARALADVLAVFQPDRLISATPDRCRQTLEPLVSRLGLPIETDDAFDESAATGVTVARLRALAAPPDVPDAAAPAAAAPMAAQDTPGAPGVPSPMATPGVATRGSGEGPGTGPVTIVSSQGKLIPRALGELLGEPPDGYATRKGDGWLLAFSGSHLVGADRLTGPPS